MQQAAPRNGDFVTPTIVGAEEYDFAERDLRYTTAMFELLTSDREFADHNKAIMQRVAVDLECRGAIAAARTPAADLVAARREAAAIRGRPGRRPRTGSAES